MALNKVVEHQGFAVPDAYFVIGRAQVHPMRVDGEKMYNVQLDINMYKDSSKEFLLRSKVKPDGEDEGFRVQVAEEGLTYANYYSLLKAMDFFKDAKGV